MGQGAPHATRAVHACILDTSYVMFKVGMSTDHLRHMPLLLLIRPVPAAPLPLHAFWLRPVLASPSTIRRGPCLKCKHLRLRPPPNAHIRVAQKDSARTARLGVGVATPQCCGQCCRNIIIAARVRCHSRCTVGRSWLRVPAVLSSTAPTNQLNRVFQVGVCQRACTGLQRAVLPYCIPTPLPPAASTATMQSAIKLAQSMRSE